jgi:predicted phage terminase large subunit-like protein
VPALLSERAVLRSLCARDYRTFFRTFWGEAVRGEPLAWAWHIERACVKLQASYERVFAGLPVERHRATNQPPGTTKSLVHSVLSHPWGLTRMPHMRWLGASYSGSVAEKLSSLARDVVKSELYHDLFPEVQIRPDQDTKSHWATAGGGEHLAVGCGGAVTGKMHAHVICIDDALNPEQALSDAEVFAVNHWIGHTLLNRKADKRVTFVDLVGQRVRQGDATDEFKRVVKNVDHEVLPADLDYPVQPPELAAHYADGLMDPERLGPEALAEEKLKGEQYYAGQFGQSPKPAGGGKFRVDRLRHGRPPEKFAKLVRYWDKAASVKKGSKWRGPAYTVGVLMGQEGLGPSKRYWIPDVVRVRLDSSARERLIRRTAMRDGRAVVVGVEQEPGSGGKDSALATVQRLNDHMRRTVHTVPASGSKEVRADEFSVAVNAGLVWLPEDLWDGSGWTGWAKDFVEELSYWPYSQYKDQGDAAGGAYNLLGTPRRHVGPLPGKRVAGGEPVG